MKVLFIDSVHPSLFEKLTFEGFFCDLNYPLDYNDALSRVSDYDGVVIRSKFKIDKDFIDAASELKFIARFGAGMENIDVPYAESKGIRCLHAPEGNRDAVGEHVVGMLLTLFRNINKANAEVRDGIWLREENRGVELSGKSVGIIGYGNMGSATAKKFRGFDVNVLAHDKYKSGFGDEFVQEASLQQIFETADIVSLHLPLTNETHHYANELFFSSFKKEIYFVNTARGKNLNTSALVSQLKSGKVKGACLDVLEYEKVSFEGITEQQPEDLIYLMSQPNVILTPHIGGWTHESNKKMAEVIFQKIRNIVKP